MVSLGASVIFQQQDKLLWAAILASLGVLCVIVTYWRFPQTGPWKWGAAGLKILGLLLLLFTIGLKLNPKEIAAPQVWGVGLLQIVIAVPSTTAVILLADALLRASIIISSSIRWSLAG